MKTYDVAKDIYLIRSFYRLTQQEFADAIGISRVNVARWEKGVSFPRKSELETIYSFAYKEDGSFLDINKSKEMLYRDDRDENLLLFHGTSFDIVGEADNKHSSRPNDFGDGFYLGESLAQAATWVCQKDNASAYVFYFAAHDGLAGASFKVDRRWMYAILYYRGALEEYILSDEIKSIVEEVERSDYLLVPIADNQMYDILAMFKRGEITDEACIRSLACSNLGFQYVLKSDKAFRYLKCIDRLYLCKAEKRSYAKVKATQSRDSENKAKLARIKYRRKGKYIDELFTKA